MSPLTKSHLMNSILINPTPECSRSSSPRSHDPRSAEPPYKTKGREHMTPGEHRWDDDRWGSNSDGPGMEDARPPQGPEQQPRSGDSRESSVTSDDGAQQNSAGTPSQRKKRKTQQYQKTSCELCKARKVKCDRAEPACGWCASHNRTCVYLERQKPGSRTGFNVELEAKVNRIDALLQSLGRRVEEHIAHDHPTPTVSGATPGAVPYRNSPQTIHNASSEFGQGPGPSSLGRATPMESGRAATTPGGGVVDPFSRIDTSSERMAGLELQGPGGIPNHAYSPANTATPRSLSTIPDLPPQDMIYSLVDLYFKHCNTWCPILERQTIFGVFFGSTSLSEADRVLLHAIVATTLRFFKDPRLTPHMKAHYHATSRRIVQMYVMEHISIPALRALVIICLDELGTSNGPKGWNLLSLLTQNVKQLGLCEENSVYLLADADDVPRTGSMRRVVAGRPESWIEDEGRRRLAWMVYLLDRYATVATTTFDFMLGDQRMKRFLPCSYDLFSRNVPRETRQPSNVLEPADPNNYANVANNAQLDSLGSFSYHCEILRIMSEVHNFLKTPLDVTSPSDMAGWRNKYQLLDAALDRWLQSLPSEYSRISALCHSDPASRVANWFMLHSAYVTAVIRLHSSAAYPTVRTEIFVPSHYAMQRCLSAVQSLRDISQDVYEADGLDLLGPPFAFSLWVAARLLLVHAATVGAPVDEKIEFFIETLGYVGQYWEVANNYARILKRVVQRGQQSDLSFSAMRRSAHDLVTLTGSARRSGLDPTSTQATSLSELDSIDVFDFFHYPKVADEAMTRNAFGQTNLLQPQTMDGRQPVRAVPDPDSDWLRMGSYQ